MKNGVNQISQGIFELEEKKNLFLDLRNKNSKILQYCNYLLLKEKKEEYHKNLVNNLKIYHKKIKFIPITKKNPITFREYAFHKINNFEEKNFSNKNIKNKKVNCTQINKKNLTLEKIRYNSANNKFINKNKNLINNNNYKNNRLILVPLELRSSINNKGLENNSKKRKKFKKKLNFKNSNTFYKINLLNRKTNENDMIFPKKFLIFKKELSEETFRSKEMLKKFENYIFNNK